MDKDTRDMLNEIGMGSLPGLQPLEQPRAAGGDREGRKVAYIKFGMTVIFKAILILLKHIKFCPTWQDLFGRSCVNGNLLSVSGALQHCVIGEPQWLYNDIFGPTCV